MKLLMSDTPLSLPEGLPPDARYVDLSHLHIANCIGCFGCWVKTPGRCVIRDDAVKVYPLIAQSEKLLYISRLAYGSYDIPMKTMLERCIPIQQAFIRLHHGEAHHVQRDVKEKDAVIIAYGDADIPPEERQLFQQFVKRNSYNMQFCSCRVVFTDRAELEETVQREADLWKS